MRFYVPQNDFILFSPYCPDYKYFSTYCLWELCGGSHWHRLRQQKPSGRYDPSQRFDHGAHANKWVFPSVFLGYKKAGKSALLSRLSQVYVNV